ncbi:hypothetical protein BU25DRAFT_485025 [Macroventuria anomochaeta]|uniref:Uncharacterized protein n=1 Tax=Macroventuria anomochaeta TaxID=301207 RepID=A0ACB6S9N4_9PLEO|nr:uncharacterized protein BU25DRAFT_485025 [Macroventuria anomochaeta]KAF2629934.1 hypothetical protein BU25DRAFT_485025 [Macroventuria anomochaeta]
MVDNKGWRKKIGGKPKELPPMKTGSDETAAVPLSEVAIESIDRRRHGWRKTIAASRPVTPMTPAPPTPTQEDVDDTRSERSEASTPRRDSKPKLNRYTSLFATHKEEAASPVFSEPWSADAPPTQEDPWSYVDPVVAMESIHSHMCKNYMVPVPLEYNSGLFQVFDDYRKLRSHKELLEAREQEAIEHSRKVTARWLQSEELYEAEIRRLELLIARGTTGMTGLMKARQGTVVDRKRQHRRTISTDRVLPRYQHMSPVEVDEEIRAKSQQILLHRPTSPSGKMTALSRQLTSAGLPDLPIGTPPSTNRESTLSRKVKSELNLMGLRHADALQSLSNAVTPDPLSTTEHVPEEANPEHGLLVKDPIECDAFIALKELGALVARRKGLDVSSFVNGLLALLTSGQAAKTVIEPNANEDKMQSPAAEKDRKVVPADDVTPRPPFRKPRPHSYQELDQKRRRHFSFEPGDDQMRELEADLKSYDSLSQTDSTDSESSSSSAFRLFDDGLQTGDDDSIPLLSSLGADFPKPSMIPSPVQTVGRMRRENSMSSLQSVFVKNIRDDRHNSRTSVQTAFREAASANASIKSKSRSSSNHNLRAAESPLGSKERLNSLANRHSTAALAAARAAEARSSNLSRSNTRLSTATSSSRTRQTAGQERSENNDPKMCNNASKGDAE